MVNRREAGGSRASVRNLEAVDGRELSLRIDAPRGVTRQLQDHDDHGCGNSDDALHGRPRLRVCCQARNPGKSQQISKSPPKCFSRQLQNRLSTYPFRSDEKCLPVRP